MDASTAVSNSATASLIGFAIVIFLLLFLIAKWKWHVFFALLIPIMLFGILPGVQQNNFIDAFEGISTPVHILAGNHDGQLMYEVCSHFPSCSSAKVISLGHWRILMLDSTVNQQIYGMINLQQQQWIEQEISKSPNSSFLICCHHHPEPVGSAWIDQHMMKNGAQFLSFLSQFKQVKMVSFGHIHQCHENMFEHIQIISTPATSVQFTPGVDVFTLDDKQPGFRWFELNDSGRYHTQIERLAPNTFVANPQATGY